MSLAGSAATSTADVFPGPLLAERWTKKARPETSDVDDDIP